MKPRPATPHYHEQREYWDQNLDLRNLSCASAGEIPDLEKEWAFFMSPEQVFALQRIGAPAGLRVLEVGGGLGLNALWLARRGARVTVLDLSGERLRMLARLAEREGLRGRLELVQGVAEALPFRDESFDREFTKSVLLHVNLDQAAPELRRVLRNGGKGIFVETMAQNPFVNLYRRFFGPPIWRTIAKYFDEARLREIARPFGGARVWTFYFLGFLAFYWQFGNRNLKRFRGWLGLLGKIDGALLSWFPGLRKRCWFAVVEVEKNYSQDGPGFAALRRGKQDEQDKR